MKIQSKHLYYLILLLTLPALLINLGRVAFINDEAIRALVALEMDLSGNYITPTLFGEYYYNKPPLYNWILLIFTKIYGSTNEFISRLPTVIFLLAYAASIFHFTKKYFATRFAFINAFALITCGRILFYDSFLGLIDICFSWVIYLLFMVVYEQWKAQNLYRLFGIAYFLAALAFLMKGLPALVFLGTCLLVHFIYQQQFKLLFRPAHFLGMAIFGSMVGSYYYAYAQYQDLRIVFETLFIESAKRTPVEYGWLDTVSHLFTFPFEMVWHFLPWTLLVLYFFQKGIKNKLQKHPFVAYNFLLFITTIPLYWISVEVYPRYLFMHVPLFFTTVLYLYFGENSTPKDEEVEVESCQTRLLHPLFKVFIFIAPLAVCSLPFLGRNFMEVPYAFLKLGITGIAVIASIFLLKRLDKNKSNLLLCLILTLLIVRIGFNWFILPSREKVERTTVCRDSAIHIGEKFKEENFYSFQDVLGWNPASAYYLTRQRGEILSTGPRFVDSTAIYMVPPRENPWVIFKPLDTLQVHFKKGKIPVGYLKRNPNYPPKKKN